MKYIVTVEIAPDYSIGSDVPEILVWANPAKCIYIHKSLEEAITTKKYMEKLYPESIYKIYKEV